MSIDGLVVERARKAREELPGLIQPSQADMDLVALLGEVERLSLELAKSEKEHDEELGRWQQAIYQLIKEQTGADMEIDGGGCDSGDPLDLTLTEIGQGFAYLDDKCFDLLEGLGLFNETEVFKQVEESKSALSIVLDLFPKHLTALTIAEGKLAAAELIAGQLTPPCSHGF